MHHIETIHKDKEEKSYTTSKLPEISHGQFCQCLYGVKTDKKKCQQLTAYAIYKSKYAVARIQMNPLNSHLCTQEFSKFKYTTGAKIFKALAYADCLPGNRKCMAQMNILDIKQL